MFGLVKMSAVSAVLSVGIVTTFDPPALWAQDAPVVKPFQDRIAADEGVASSGAADERTSSADFIAVTPVRNTKSNRLTTSSDRCAAQTWPHLSSDCISGASGGLSRQVRVITIERREGTNTSILTRVPQAVAQR
ncbi:hypothetical protein [Microvirga massiliensis]|uniref:hypothetical protein n=1 Tax=Microvirga massiliensis TaxID=1033741 RepID=UPI00062BDFA6|nr:hypothetical protein [Microvirga massiliensis]